MDSSSSSGRGQRSKPRVGQGKTRTRKPRVLLAATDCLAVFKFDQLCCYFSEWADLKAIATRSAVEHIDEKSMPKDTKFLKPEKYPKSENGMLKLMNWADVLVIVPLNLETLCQIAPLGQKNVESDIVVRIFNQWDCNKPRFVAPAIGTIMWQTKSTEDRIEWLEQNQVSFISPQNENMAEHSCICDAVKACELPECVRIATVANLKPKILLASSSSGFLDSKKLNNLCHDFSDWAQVRLVADIACEEVNSYTNEDQFSTCYRRDENQLTMKLVEWADALVITPLLCDTLDKIARGLCDDLLTSLVYAWDCNKKPLYVVPAMETSVLNCVATKDCVAKIRDRGVEVIPLDPMSEHIDSAVEGQMIVKQVKERFVAREVSGSH